MRLTLPGAGAPAVHGWRHVRRAVQREALREVEGGYLRAIPLRERGFSRTMYLGCHRQREDSPLVRAVREVAATLGRANQVTRARTRKRGSP